MEDDREAVVVGVVVAIAVGRLDFVGIEADCSRRASRERAVHHLLGVAAVALAKQRRRRRQRCPSRRSVEAAGGGVMTEEVLTRRTRGEHPDDQEDEQDAGGGDAESGEGAGSHRPADEAGDHEHRAEADRHRAPQQPPEVSAAGVVGVERDRRDRGRCDPTAAGDGLDGSGSGGRRRAGRIGGRRLAHGDEAISEAGDVPRPGRSSLCNATCTGGGAWAIPIDEQDPLAQAVLRHVPDFVSNSVRRTLWNARPVMCCKVGRCGLPWRLESNVNHKSKDGRGGEVPPTSPLRPDFIRRPAPRRFRLRRSTPLIDDLPRPPRALARHQGPDHRPRLLPGLAGGGDRPHAGHRALRRDLAGERRRGDGAPDARGSESDEPRRPPHPAPLLRPLRVLGARFRRPRPAQPPTHRPCRPRGPLHRFGDGEQARDLVAGRLARRGRGERAADAGADREPRGDRAGAGPGERVVRW